MNSIETHALRLIGENLDSPDVFVEGSESFDQIRGSANDAIQELCMVTGSYTQTYLLPLFADRQFYRLEPRRDYIACILDVWDAEQNFRLTQTDPNTLSIYDPMWMQTAGPQDKYMPLGRNCIGIYRAPSATGKILQVKCACIPKPYETDKDVIKLREAFQRAAAYFTVSEYFASRGDATRASEYHVRYLETANLMSFMPQPADRSYAFRTDKK